MKKVITILLLATFLLASTAEAQLYKEEITSRDITLTLDPPTPGTNEEVTANLSSLLVDVNRMIVTWFIDGQIIESGYGENEVTFTTGDQGETTSIEAYIQIDTQNAIRKWARVSPADLDILWEADTYTPPFYRGKALPTPESFIRIVGIPNVRNEGAQKLENGMVFNWRLNGKNVPDESGYAANPLIIRNDFLRLEERVDLEVIHRDGLTKAVASTIVPILDPEVIVYEEDSYLRKANAVDTNNRKSILRFQAEPYYFSVKNELMNTLSFNWFMNGSTILEQTSNKKNELIATLPEEGAVTELGVKIDHPSKPLQETDIVNFNVIQ